MKGKKISFGLSERKMLKEVLPLEKPLSIVFDPSSACNFRCIFCKNSDEKFRKTTRITSFEVFETLIENLQKCDLQIETLSLAREGEPLMNKRFADMISLAKKSGVFKRVVTISNGALLTPEISDSLVNAGLDRILISIQGMTSEKYKQNCGVNVDLDKIIENIKYLHSLKKCMIHIKGFYPSKEECNNLDEFRNAFYEKYEDICDEISLEYVMPVMKEIDYSSMNLMPDVDRYGNKVSKTDVCPTAFYTLQILPNGDVSICCLNNEPYFIVGNIYNESIKEIFHNNKINTHRLLHLKGNRCKHKICKNCYFPERHANPKDKLDEYANDLIKFYEEIIKILK